MIQGCKRFQSLISNVLIRLLLFSVHAVAHKRIILTVHSQSRRTAVLLHLLIHGFLQAQSEGDHHYDGGRSDHHPQYGQECP